MDPILWEDLSAKFNLLNLSIKKTHARLLREAVIFFSI